VTTITVPRDLVLGAAVDGVELSLDVALSALSPDRTRLRVRTTAAARTLSARMVLQSAKLMRDRIDKGHAARVAAFCARAEAEYAPAG
jgi:hypothetical protein